MLAHYMLYAKMMSHGVNDDAKLLQCDGIHQVT